jgi:Tfp pilus assembly protein PilO
MDKTKQTLVAALMAMLVVVAGGWFLLISPQRSSVASLNDQTEQVGTQNAKLQTQISQLKAESAQVSGAQATLAAIARRLPPDPQEANLLDNLTKAASAANVDLQIIVPSPPVLATAATVTTAPTTAATSSGSTAGAAPATQAAVAAANQLYQIPLSLTVAGNYFDIEMFVHSLEGLQRAMVIDQVSLAAAVTNGQLATPAPGASGQPTSGTSAPVTTTATTSAKSATHAAAGKSTTKPAKPGTAAGAQAEIDKLTPYVPDSNTLAVTITGKVFAMFSPGAALAVAAAGVAAAPAAVTPTPATTK